MKISDHIRHSLDACDKKDLDQAMLFACLGIDGTAKKTYPHLSKVGERFRSFIDDNLDVIEVMFGGLNLKETVFPFKDSKGKIGISFADIVYEKYRCSLAHGDELPDGFGVAVQLSDHHQRFKIDIANKSMTMPQSVIYALGFACVLAPVNKDQKIGDDVYFYKDTKNRFVVDQWWGEVQQARATMDFGSAIRVKMDFSNVWPAS